jgi:predicted 3-demethylubiquinone-9 3-methyltransferase (glyoxalase superfamily)
LGKGGQIEQCGWLRDRYGVYWQIHPDFMPKLMSDSDPAKAKRVMEAMMKMVKLDIAELQKAYEGK